MDKTLVLRTIYLDPSQDERLREFAAELNISKATLIRVLLDFGLDHKDSVKDWRDE